MVTFFTSPEAYEVLSDESTKQAYDIAMPGTPKVRTQDVPLVVIIIIIIVVKEQVCFMPWCNSCSL
eukprot:1575985-Amphidinium_carterae.1